MGIEHSVKLGVYSITVEEGWRNYDDGNLCPYAHVGWSREDGVLDILPHLGEIRTAAILFFKNESKFAGLTFEEFIRGMFDDQSFR